MQILGSLSNEAWKGVYYGAAAGLFAGYLVSPIAAFLTGAGTITAHGPTSDDRKAPYVFYATMVSGGLLGACLGGFTSHMIGAAQRVATSYFNK